MPVLADRCNLCRTPVRRDLEPTWVKDGFAIVRCPVCRLLFRREQPTSDELTQIYDGAYFGAAGDCARPENYLDYLAEESGHRRSSRARLARIAKWSRPGTLLDVGAAAGFFVDEAARAGWRARGVDVAAAMTNWGREHLQVELERATFAELEGGGAPFDAITMWDYIEHSLDPRTDVEKAYALLRPGGLLALSTGDVDSLAAQLTGKRWHLLTPRHHNFYFSPRTIESLLYTAGFELLEIAHPSVPCSVKYCLHKLQTMTPSARLAKLARTISSKRLGDAVVPVNLLDVMTVVAQKPSR